MDDEILFMDEDQENEESSGSSLFPPWKVLIVDDEKEVHHVTEHVLQDFKFKNRGLKFLHAYSSIEAREEILNNLDIALIFLDVVMETDDAGLKFVEYVRNSLKNQFVRIVLRTGQPGQAPEKKVVMYYDIDDYRSKTELTALRLFTTTVAALRSYSVIMAQEESKHALEELARASWAVHGARNKSVFSQTVRPQIATFMALGENSFYAEVLEEAGGYSLKLLMGRGRFHGTEEDARKILTDGEYKYIMGALDVKDGIYGDKLIVGVVSSSDGVPQRVLFVESYEDFSELDKSLIKIFISSMDSAFENIILSDQIEEEQLSKINMQKKLLERLNNVISLRSKETSAHVNRVAECSFRLAKLAGCDDEWAACLSTASPMHDVGKIGIPDSILLKPGKLTDDEWEQMKNHTIIGEKMFAGDETPLIKMAANVAGSHHEKWDGSGYPKGLSGLRIPLEGRISAICDVFDALMSRRPYKEPWPVEKVRETMMKGRETHFDPTLLDLFIENFDDMKGVFEKYS